MIMRPTLFLAVGLMPSSPAMAQSKGPVVQVVVIVGRIVARGEGTLPRAVMGTAQAARREAIDLMADVDLTEHYVHGKAA